MLGEKKKNILGLLILLTATVLWGTSFILLKDAIDDIPLFYIFALRFTAAALLILICFFKRVIKISRGTFLRGALVGVILIAAYTVQTIGLKTTTASRNAFLTSSYCILVPFMMWLFFKEKPKMYNVIAAVLCFVGVGFLVLDGKQGGASMLIGDAFSFSSGIFYGFQIIVINKFHEKNDDFFQFLFADLLVAGLGFIVLSLIFDLPTYGLVGYKLTLEQALLIGYLTVACTFIAQLCQLVGQKFAKANEASIVLSMEAVFGTFFAIVLGNEKLTIFSILGFAIVLVALLVNEGVFKFKKND